jgi:tetratricopeptide (TPR) repeat protein
VGALKQTLLGEEDKIVIASAPRTQNTEAYTAYLRGKHVMRERNEENLYKALREFRHATEVDPDFAPAWAGVANAYSLLGNYEYRAETEVLPLANDAVDKALLLDPNLAEGWAAKGLLLMQERTATEESIPVLEKAVALNPGNAETLMWLGSQLGSANRFEEGWAAYQQAYDVDPLFPVLLSNLAISSASRGDDASAARYLSELQSVAPDALTTYRARAFTAWVLGELAESFRILADGVDAGMDDVFMINLLADRHLDYGKPEQAVRLAGRARQINPLSAWATQVEASKLYLEGRQDKAITLVEEALVRQPDEEDLLLPAGLWARLEDDAEAAREHFERGLKSDAQTRAWIVDDPDAVFIASFLIDIYRESGDAEAAQALYETATRYNLNGAWGGEGSWWDNYLQAWVEGAIGNVEAMKMRLEKAANKGGQSIYSQPWAVMLLRHADDPEVAGQLQRLDARRREIAQALAADGLIGESASEPAG